MSKNKVFEGTTPCNDIDVISWESMPRTTRVVDYCDHCEFKCDHGKQLIYQHNKMIEFQKRCKSD